MKKFLLIVILISASLFLAACGGGETSSESEAVTLNVSGLDEFRFDPADVTVPAGSQVTLNFENAGVLEHSWVLTNSSVDPATATDADALAGANTGTVAGGASNTISFPAPAPGTYNVVCLVPGHAAGGMVGTLTVTE